MNRRNSTILVLLLLKPKFQALPRAFRCNITTTTPEARINEVLKQLNMTMVPEPTRNVESVGLELHTDMGGERMHAICSKIWKVLMLKNSKRSFSPSRSGRWVAESGRTEFGVDIVY